MDKPKTPVTIYALALVAVAGLVAQFLAAENAFALVGRGLAYSVAAALLIETAVVVDGLVFARSRHPVAGAGLLIALAVSGIYNYAQAHAAAPELHPLVLSALAVGPLAALVSVGLALGEELYHYEQSLTEWEAEQHKAELLKRREREARTRQRQQLDEQERAFERELDRRRLEHKLKEERLATRRRERWERRTMTGQMTDDRTVTGQMAGNRTDGRRWPDKDAFLSDPDRPDDLTAGQLSEMAGVSGRTARRWLAEVRSSNGREPTS
jgi:hypothetical protein